jgi:hypothetical protein
MKVPGNTATIYAPELAAPKKLAITRSADSTGITDAPIYSGIPIK